MFSSAAFQTLLAASLPECDPYRRWCLQILRMFWWTWMRWRIAEMGIGFILVNCNGGVKLIRNYFDSKSCVSVRWRILVIVQESSLKCWTRTKVCNLIENLTTSKCIRNWHVISPDWFGNDGMAFSLNGYSSKLNSATARPILRFC